MAHAYKPNPQQQSLPFAQAEASAAERLMQLGRALRDISANANLGKFMRLIFDQTASGMTEWSACDELIIGHAWGLTSKDTLVRVRQQAKDCGILSIAPIRDSFGRVAEWIYAIYWPGVYYIRGLPLPLNLQSHQSVNHITSVKSYSADLARQSVITPNSVEDAPQIAECKSILLNAEAICITQNAEASHNISAGAHVIVNDEEDKDKLIFVVMSLTWDQIAPLCFFTWRTIYKSLPGILQKPPEEQCWELIISAVVLGKSLHHGEKWLEYSTAAVKSKGRGCGNPAGYFKKCLQNNLAEYLGQSSKAEAGAKFGHLITLVRPKVKELMRCWHDQLQRIEANRAEKGGEG